MSKKEITNEGFLDYLGNILKGANDKRFIAGLDRLEKSGPGGQKAVKQFKDRAVKLEKDFQAVNKWMNITN